MSETEFLASYALSPLDRGVSNPNLSLFRAVGADTLLVKKFTDSSAAEREIQQYQLFAGLPFIPELVKDIPSVTGRMLAYQWIEGKNLFDTLRETKDSTVELWAIWTTLQHALEMGNHLSEDSYKNLQENGTKYSIANPLYRGVLSPQLEENFDIDYREVQQILAMVCEFFPGIFSDRNPGNVLLTPDQKIYQVDFGFVEATSPLFDMVRLLRTRTLEPSTQDLELSANAIQVASELENEEELLNQLYSLYRESNNHPWNYSRDVFQRAFTYAALNEHIFFLSKAIGLLRSGRANVVVQTQRQHYHAHMLPRTFQSLLTMGEPVHKLEPYIDSLRNQRV